MNMSSKSMWVFAAAVVVLIMFWASFYGSSDPKFCLNCHEMRDNYASWTKSNHSKVDCAGCHIEPGVVNKIARKSQALGEVAKHFTSAYKTPINKDSSLSKNMSSEICTGCHKTPAKVDYGVVTFPHKDHLKTNCTYCHNRVAHKDLNGYLDRTSMIYCMDCHKKKKELAGCNTCHPNGVAQKPASHLNGNWVSMHEKSVAKYCYACHNKGFCDHCHKNPKQTIPPTHLKADWQKTHKTGAFAGCLKVCHDQQYCDNCHHNFYAMPDTHKTGKWLTEHKKLAISECSAYCHKASFCAKCHSGSQISPTSHKSAIWAYEGHQKASNASCVKKCHVLQDCNGCHTTTYDQDAGEVQPDEKGSRQNVSN
jgi:cytochrome c nitrite reductase small subunit